MSQLTASLPMYDFSGLKSDTNNLWKCIYLCCKEHFKNTPKTLNYDIENLFQHWQQGNLFLSQTCGWPLISKLQFEPIATPIYTIAGCDNGFYHSVLITRQHHEINSFKEERLIINEKDSWSGYISLIKFAEEHRLPLPEPSISGSHFQSIIAILNNKADVACIDAITLFYLFELHPKWREQIKIIAKTKKVPALPLISAPCLGFSEKLREILSELKTDSALGIAGFRYFSLEEYRHYLA